MLTQGSGGQDCNDRERCQRQESRFSLAKPVQVFMKKTAEVQTLAKRSEQKI
jgi:hypothetical protein